MRVLALAALDVPYIRDNWMDAVDHVLGDDVVMVNVTPLLACQGPGAHVQYVNRLVATQHFDYAFLYHDYIFSDFADDFFGHLRGAGIRTCTFHPDDDGEVWYQRNRAFDGRYDVVASHSKRAAERRCRERRPTSPIYLPWGFNQRFFDRPSAAAAPQYDVVFIGKYKVHDQDASLFREDGRQRDETLCRVAEDCERRGRTFRVFGHGWERHPRLARFAGGLLSHEQMLAAYHASRIVLNPGWSADPTDSVPQTKLRHFEVPGCGAFQLTNVNPELAELFEPEREIAFFRDSDDLVEQVDRYLRDEDARARVAAAGHARAHAEHTLDHRVRALFAQMESRWPSGEHVASRAPRVEAIDVRTRADVAALRDDIVSGRRSLDHADAVHVRLCAGNIIRTRYVELAGAWPASADLFGVRTFFDTNHARRNPLQPMRHEISGGILSHAARLDAVPAAWRRALGEQLAAVEDAERMYPLINYIARTHALVPLLDAYLADDPARMAALDVATTGLVLTEVRVDTPPREQATAAEPPVLAALRRLLREATTLDARIAIYGARGELAELTIDTVRRHPAAQLVGLIDRSMAGASVAGIPVYGSFDLPALAPDFVLIAAAYSGPAILEQLKPLEPRMTLVPLYDLGAPIWSMLLP
jgi:hypothetical protein